MRCRGRKSHKHAQGWPKLVIYGTSRAKAQKWFLRVADSTLTDFNFEESEPEFFRGAAAEDPARIQDVEGWQDETLWVLNILSG